MPQAAMVEEQHRSSPELSADLRRFALVAICLPTAIALIDQLTWMNPSLIAYEARQQFFFPWMIAKTALLAWCAGRIFGSTLYGWILLSWGVALIDVHTYGASHSLFGSSDMVGLTYTIVSAQASFLILWSILAKTAAAWRIASGMVATTIIIFHASLLGGFRMGDAILLMQTMAAAILAIVCLALRLFGYKLEQVESTTEAPGRAKRDVFQFGLKHMLVWTTALPPLLLVVKGIDILIIRNVGVADLFPAALVSSCIAFVSMGTIWFAVGRGNIVLRLAFFAFAILISGFTMYAQSSNLVTLYGQWPRPLIVHATVLIGDRWVHWFALVGGLLASLLAFLTAAGYRLQRVGRAASP
jgi:hypothetical protein